ncbi:MAG: Crp/Fnr family transcriptional regulator [Burkholderiaceae bacterium]|nr:Crp/Fnr family transcriptional regulator [Burkholderiaceae bacterium]
MLQQHSPGQNRLLAALSTGEMERLFSHLELVQMRLGDIVYEPGEKLQYAYFPTTAIVSLHYVTESGATCETSGVGSEGVVGVPLFMGGDSTPSSAVVHTAGHAYRLQRHMMKQEFDRHGLMGRVLLNYVQALITQISQTAVCNRHHSVEQQVCRWLLMTLDRIPSGELVMTQELIAGVLGVRREGITQAAGKLQHAGYIRYRRGHLTVLDRTGLETHACECYSVVKKELGRLAVVPRH